MSAWINYHHLFYFKAIAEEGSVSAAAQKLKLGQPTLSAQLKQFEEALGIELFERRHKRLVLTEQGRVALDYARNIFNLGHEMYEVLHDRLKPHRPALCIGALDSIPKQVVIQLVRAAMQTMPCQVSLVEGRSDELLRELNAHRVDLWVTNFLPRGSEAKQLFHRSVASKAVSFFGAPKYKGLRKGFPESVSGEPLIVPTYDSKLRYDLDHWAELHGISLDVVVESQDIAVKEQMAVEGLGLVPAASYAVTQQVASGELVEIGTLHGVREELFLVTAQRKIENPLAAALMKTFRL